MSTPQHILDGIADGIAEELEWPYNQVEIEPRNQFNGYKLRIRIDEDSIRDTIDENVIGEVESWNWNFVCFSTKVGNRAYALFERGPFPDDSTTDT